MQNLTQNAQDSQNAQNKYFNYCVEIISLYKQKYPNVKLPQSLLQYVK